MIKKLVARTGFSFFPIALVARLPFAMMVVGVLTLVVVARDSLLLGGLNSALVGAGTAIFGPLIGAAADRFGQKHVLLIAGFLNASFLVIFVYIVWLPANLWLVFTCAFLIGASAPQVSAMSRSRLVGIVADSFEPKDKDRVLSGVMAYESTIDETVFVFGPFIVGLLAVTFGAGAPVLTAAFLTVSFVSFFALHPSSKPLMSKSDRDSMLAPVSDLFKAKVSVVVIGIFGMGIFFGTMLTSLTAYMQAYSDPERTGILYGILGLGSATLALAVAFFPPSFSKRSRWIFFSFVMLAGILMLQLKGSELQTSIALLLIGCGVGPILVTQYNFGAERSPAGRDSTLMTILGAAITVGQALSSALTGWLSELVSADKLLLMPLLAVFVLLVTGVINFFLTPGGKIPSKLRSTI